MERYLKGLRKRTGLQFPRFADEAMHTAPILAVLLTPGGSGAEATGVVTVDNDDPTARRLKGTLEEAGVDQKRIVLWNFFSAYNYQELPEVFWYQELPEVFWYQGLPKKFWSRQIETLTGIMRRLRVVVVFGNEAWLGIRDVHLRKGIALIGAPHPSNRVTARRPAAEREIVCVWKRAKRLLD